LKDHLQNPDLKGLVNDFENLFAGYGIYPYLWAARRLLGIAGEFHYNPILYLMAASKGRYDEGYDISSPRFSDLVQEMKKNNYTLGLHASYDTFLNEKKLLEEKQVLEQRLAIPIDHIRQHYLRFNATESWAQWERCGFHSDSSVGYADHPGFRCGTCHEFPLFDICDDRELRMMETPLIVMDKTLSSSLKLGREESKTAILALAQKCRQVGGKFTFLWHSTSLVHTSYEWGNLYLDVLPQLLEI